MARNTLINIIFTVIIVILAHFLWPVETMKPLPQQSITESVLDRIKRTNIVRCGYVAWPPWFAIDPNTKQISGVSHDISDAIFASMGWKVQYVEIVGGNEVESLKNNKIDVMCGTGPFYLASLKEVNYSHPLMYSGAYMYGRDGETFPASPQGLNKPETSFVGIDGDVSVDLTRQFYPQAKLQTLAGTTDVAQMLLTVATKKAGFVITDPISVANYNRNNPVKLKSLYPQKPVAVYGVGFGVKKGETELLQTLNGYADMALNLNMIDPILRKCDPDSTLFMSAAKTYQSK